MFDNTFLDGTEDLIVSFLQHQAYLAPILLLTLEEAGVPLPLPGDFIVIYTGYQVRKGAIPYPVAFASIMVAILLGSTILYFLSARYGQEIVLKLGYYIHLDKKKLLTVEEKFRKYGMLVIIIGRHIPGFRIPITIFSGISEITYKKFILSTFISVIFSTALNLSIGERLGPKALKLFHAHHSLYFFTALPLILTIIWYIFVVIKGRGKTAGKNK